MSDHEISNSSAEHRRLKRRLSADEKLLVDRIKLAGENGGHLPSEVLEFEPSNPKIAERNPSIPMSEMRLGAGCHRFAKLSFRTLCWLYLLIAGVLIFGTHYSGQGNVMIAALMYAPPLIWLPPGLVLLPPVLFFDWKSGLCLLASIMAFFAWHLDFQARTTTALETMKAPDTVRVLSWNRGQGKKASLSALKADLHLDLILLQEAKLSNYLHNPDYAEFQDIQSMNDVVILSRTPILELTPIYRTGSKLAHPDGLPWGMRCVVFIAGQRCVIYNLHLPTPRDALESYMRGACLWGVIGLVPYEPWQRKRELHESFWKPYLDFSLSLQKQLLAESDPVILAGDFNTPPMGPIHRQLTKGLQDSHIAAGSGFGFTFPGDTHNPLSLFQPWLRLDRIHFSKHWQALHCSTYDLPAQHLPVIAELQLLPSPHQ